MRIYLFLLACIFWGEQVPARDAPDYRINCTVEGRKTEAYAQWFESGPITDEKECEAHCLAVGESWRKPGEEVVCTFTSPELSWEKRFW